MVVEEAVEVAAAVDVEVAAAGEEAEGRWKPLKHSSDILSH